MAPLPPTPPHPVSGFKYAAAILPTAATRLEALPTSR